jgi:hypothetical protein
MSAPRFFVGAISQRGAMVTAAIRLFFSPTQRLTGFGGIALLPHRSNKVEPNSAVTIEVQLQWRAASALGSQQNLSG